MKKMNFFLNFMCKGVSPACLPMHARVHLCVRVHVCVCVCACVRMCMHAVPVKVKRKQL